MSNSSSRNDIIYKIEDKFSYLCSVLEEKNGKIDELSLLNQKLREEKILISSQVKSYLKELEEIRSYYVDNDGEFARKKV